MMRCPKCGNEVRPSNKYPGYYLCDTCKKRYPASSVVDDEDDYEDDDNYDEEPETQSSEAYDYYDTPKSIKSGPKAKPKRSSGSSRPKNKKKKKKGGAWKIILVIILLLAAAVAAAKVFGFGTDKKAKKNDSGKAAVSQNKDDKKETDKDTYTIGETADYNNVQIQLLNYEESNGNDWGAPAEGKVFVFVNMEIANNSEEEIAVSSMMSFENYCGDYKLDYSSNAFTALATDTDKQQMDGTIAAGKKLNGYLCLEVPTDWTSVEIHYTDSVWSSSKIKFVINKQ